MFIGRAKEKEVLLDALQSNESEMVAVIGRRRVGKTFLVREVYSEHLDLEVTGIMRTVHPLKVFIVKRLNSNA